MKIKIEVEYKGQKLVKELNFENCQEYLQQEFIVNNIYSFMDEVDQMLEQEENEELEDYIPDWVD